MVYSEHIHSGKILFVLATNEALDLLQRSRSKPFKGAVMKNLDPPPRKMDPLAMYFEIFGPPVQIFWDPHGTNISGIG